MNCRPENYVAFITFKANGWHEIATCAIDKGQRAWGRKKSPAVSTRSSGNLCSPGAQSRKRVRDHDGKAIGNDAHTETACCPRNHSAKISFRRWEGVHGAS